MDESDTTLGPDAGLRRRSTWIWVRALLGLVTFVALCLWMDPREIVNHLADLDWLFVAVGLGICVLALLARAYKWLLIVRQMGLNASFWRITEVYTISYWFNLFLPGSMGGDLFKVVDLARASDRVVRPTVTVLMERITGVLALVAVSAVMLLTFHRSLPVHGWMVWTALGVSTLAMVGLLLLMVYFRPIWSLVSHVVPFLNRLVKPGKAKILGDVAQELRTKPRIFVVAFVWSLIVQALVLCAFYMLARAVSPGVSELYFFTFFPLVELASMVPISINGMGIREGLMVYSLQEFDIAPATAMSMGILFRLNAILHGLVGGLLLVCRRSAVWRTQPVAGA